MLPFPEPDGRTVLTQKAIDRIKLMDDETFEKFIAYIINHAQKGIRFNIVNPDIIREALYQLRNSDKSILLFEDDTKNKYQTVFTTSCCPWPRTFENGGFLVCILQLLLLPFIIIREIIKLIFGWQPCSGITCKIPCTSDN